jgi:hypothetical protein
MESPELVVIACFVCGRVLPDYFLFYHLAAHEEEGVIVRLGHGNRGRVAGRRAATPQDWQWADWIAALDGSGRR